MIIIYGVRNFGKVDRVPGVCYVVTKFVHLYFVPLIPLGSYLVVEGSEIGNQLSGKSTSLSLKSIAAAWARYALFLAFVFCTIFSVINIVEFTELNDPATMGTGIVLGLAAAACAGLFWATYRLFKPSYRRALELADELGVPASLVEKCMGQNRADGDIERDRYDFNGQAAGDYDYARR